MKKSSARKRSRAGSGAVKAAVADAEELDPRANGDPHLSAALTSFEALTAQKQLHFLAVVLREEIGRKAEAPPASAEMPPEPAPQEPLSQEPKPEHPRAEPATLAVPAAPSAAAAALPKLQIIDEETAQYGRRHVQGHLPPVSIIMTMVCSFVLALAVMLWHRQSTAAASADPNPLPPASTPANPFAAAPVMRQAALPSPPPARPQPLSPPLPAPVQRHEDQRDAANDLPVELSFRRRPAPNEGEHFGRMAWHVTGRIHNLSDEALAVDISVEGDQGPAYSRVSLDPDGDAEFGFNDGLEIHPNDRVTLHSSPYGDVVSQVR